LGGQTQVALVQFKEATTNHLSDITERLEEVKKLCLTGQGDLEDVETNPQEKMDIEEALVKLQKEKDATELELKFAKEALDKVVQHPTVKREFGDIFSGEDNKGFYGQRGYSKNLITQKFGKTTSAKNNIAVAGFVESSNSSSFF